MRRLRIGVDGDAFKQPVSGVGKYLLQLGRALEAQLPDAEFIAYTRLGEGELVLPSPRWALRQEQRAWAKRIPSFAWLRSRGAAMARDDRLDVFWAGRSIAPALGVGVRHVVTVHDLNHRIVPATMQRATRWSHRIWFDRSVADADAVFVNSHGTRDRLLHFNGRAADLVIEPAVDEHYRPLPPQQTQEAIAHLSAAYGIRPPYILAVGTLEPRKNLETLFRAFALLRSDASFASYQLVLVGPRGWQGQALMQELQSAHGLGVRLPGFVPEEDMPLLMSSARVLVCPSLYEGFGMPVAEALACGTRVLVSNLPELIEASQGTAARWEPESGANGLASDLARVLHAEDSPPDSCPVTQRRSWDQQAKLLAGLIVPGPRQGRVPASGHGD